MSKVIFLADYFLHQENGGAEKTDDVLIKHLDSIDVLRGVKNCHEVSINFLNDNLDKIFLVGNFVNLDRESKKFLETRCKYIIYEHDFKLDRNRNPLIYKDFIIPEENKVNEDFYRNAIAVVALSEYHRKIISLNFDFDNLYNTDSSLIDEDTLIFIESLIENRDIIAEVGIIDSKNPIKCTKQAIQFSNNNGLDWVLFSDSDYHTFLKKMSSFEKLIIFSGAVETGPRTALEAKMLGLKIICDKRNTSVANTSWISKSGTEMTKQVRDNRKRAFRLFEQLIGYENE